MLAPSGLAQEYDGLYFKAIANTAQAQNIVALADDIYQGIVADIKLARDQRPFTLYPLYVYSTKQEYLAKSGMPAWSEGAFRQGRIQTYQHEGLAPVLAHEIAHLIYWEFFGVQGRHLWLNEGLAMYEEIRLGGVNFEAGINAGKSLLRQHYVPLKELTATQSALSHKDKEAQIFYVESSFLVHYLLTRGGNVGFYEMLRALKQGKTLNEAIGVGFPGRWRNLIELEQAFKLEYVASR